MNTTILILSILKKSKDLGKNSMQIQNIDHVMGRRGERNFIGANLFSKLDELIKDKLINKKNNDYSLTIEGLEYLSKYQKE